MIEKAKVDFIGEITGFGRKLAMVERLANQIGAVKKMVEDQKDDIFFGVKESEMKNKKLIEMQLE